MQAFVQGYLPKSSPVLGAAKAVVHHQQPKLQAKPVIFVKNQQPKQQAKPVIVVKNQQPKQQAKPIIVVQKPKQQNNNQQHQNNNKPKNNNKQQNNHNTKSLGTHKTQNVSGTVIKHNNNAHKSASNNQFQTKHTTIILGSHMGNVNTQKPKLKTPNNGLYQLKDNNQFNELCKDPSNPSCVILFIPVNSSTNVYLLQLLRNAMQKLKYNNFYYLWAYTGYFPALEISTRISSYPALVAINYNKHRYSAYSGDFTQNSFDQFLQHLNDAKVSFSNMGTFNNISSR
jgi:hypothetical protein